jgi:hypothetical protein
MRHELRPPCPSPFSCKLVSRSLQKSLARVFALNSQFFKFSCVPTLTPFTQFFQFSCAPTLTHLGLSGSHADSFHSILPILLRSHADWLRPLGFPRWFLWLNSSSSLALPRWLTWASWAPTLIPLTQFFQFSCAPTLTWASWAPTLTPFTQFFQFSCAPTLTDLGLLGSYADWLCRNLPS